MQLYSNILTLMDHVYEEYGNQHEITMYRKTTFPQLAVIEIHEQRADSSRRCMEIVAEARISIETTEFLHGISQSPHPQLLDRRLD